MKAYQSLPEGYRETLQINMQKDKKTALKINVGGGIVMVIMAAVGYFIHSSFRMSWLQLVVMAMHSVKMFKVRYGR